MDIKKEFVTHAIETFETFVDNAKIMDSMVRLRELAILKNDQLFEFIDRVASLSASTSDLAICLKHVADTAINGKNKELKYFVRIMALHSWQILDEVSVLLGKDANAFIKSKCTKEVYEGITNDVDLLKTIRKSHHKFLSDIRHNLIAHKKDIKAIDQYNRIESLRPLGVYKICTDIFMIEVRLLKKLIEVIGKIDESDILPAYNRKIK